MVQVPPCKEIFIVNSLLPSNAAGHKKTVSSNLETVMGGEL